MRYKSLFLIPILVLLTVVTQLKAQDSDEDSTGLPGNNFSLQGALECSRKQTHRKSLKN